MPRHSFSKPVPFTAKQMFDMVADVGSYNQFLPLCTRSDVSGHSTDDHGVIRFKGALRIEKANLRLSETFISNVTVNPTEKTVVAVASNGPIKQLTNTWSFVDLKNGGSQTTMELDFEMANLPLRILMSASFDAIMSKLTLAFETRASDLYGKD